MLINLICMFGFVYFAAAGVRMVGSHFSLRRKVESLERELAEYKKSNGHYKVYVNRPSNKEPMKRLTRSN